jgi:hypothetical protein
MLLSPLALAVFRGKSELTSFQQPAEPFYDPECVSPPPAEFASLFLKAVKIVPLAPAAGSNQTSKPRHAFELRVVVSALEYGPFTACWLAYYSTGYKWVWCFPSFNGPGLVYLNITSSEVEEGYTSFVFPYTCRGVAAPYGFRASISSARTCP